MTMKAVGNLWINDATVESITPDGTGTYSVRMIGDAPNAPTYTHITIAQILAVFPELSPPPAQPPKPSQGGKPS